MKDHNLSHRILCRKYANYKKTDYLKKPDVQEVRHDFIELGKIQ